MAAGAAAGGSGTAVPPLLRLVMLVKKPCVDMLVVWFCARMKAVHAHLKQAIVSRNISAQCWGKVVHALYDQCGDKFIRQAVE